MFSNVHFLQKLTRFYFFKTSIITSIKVSLNMSTTNSPVFHSNMDLNNNADSSQNNTPVIDNAESPQSPPQAPRKITKKLLKETEKAGKKLAKEAIKKVIEDEKAAKKQAKEDEKIAKKQAKEDEKVAKKQAKEDAKKTIEDEKAAKKQAKEDAKKAKEDEKAAKKLARENKKNKNNTNISSEVPTQVSSEVPTQVSSEVSSEVPTQVSSEVSSDLPTQVSSDISSLKPLPAKSLKFIEFAYFLIKHFETSIPSLPINHLFSLAHTFDSPSSQASFIQNFFDNQKIIHADISRIRKNLKPSSSKPSSPNDFVSQIVHDSLLDSNDFPISTHPFYFNDQHFLIDNDHNLYDFNLHTHIGSFNPDNNSIALF